MIRRLFFLALLVVILAGAGLFFWARSAFSGDAVRNALAAQISKAIGQPVKIGGLGVSILPRVTLNLTDVAIGEPARITVAHLRVETEFRALLSRRIEHATVKLDGARIQFPLPVFSLTGSPVANAAPAAKPLVEIASVDEIVLNNVDVLRGGRTLHGDITLVPEGSGFTIRSLALTADSATLNVTGRMTDLAGPKGDLIVTATNLNILEMVAFASDFAVSGGTDAGGSAPATPAAPMLVTLSVSSDRATIGTLALSSLTATARLTGEAVTLDPIRFGVFGGTYDGTLALTLDSPPDFRLKAALAGLNAGTVMAFAGQPDRITGRLSATLDLAGAVTSANTVLRGVRGNARVDVTDGEVKGLGLVRSVVTATSMRAKDPEAAKSTGAESFTHLGFTATVANGSAGTRDLRFDSNDVLLSAVGHVKLDGTGVDLAGPLQLSEALSNEAGRDLKRYTQKDGRVTVPVSVSGPLDGLRVGVDVGEVAKRAIENRAKEELMKALLRFIKK